MKGASHAPRKAELMNVKAQTISADAFAPYGILLDPEIECPRRNYAAPVENGRSTASANLCLVRPPVVTLPLTIHEMERHAFSTQAFFPLDTSRYVIVVALGEEAPRRDQTMAFIVPGTRGISYHRGIWHIGMAVLDRPCGMAMLVHEDSGPRDTDLLPVAPFSVIESQ